VSSPTIGVLALQGDVREHLRTLTDLGVHAVAVRRPAELAACDGLILPGGESTTMAKLARTFDLFEPLRQRIAEGLPTFGTCAGMILLAEGVLDGTADQETFGGIDMTVRRNAFGRQFDSPVHAVFIRAPWVERLGEGVEALATIPSGEAVGRIVAVREGHLMATSFHPEVGADDRVHRYFVELVKQS
jgi:5'-phosphate synthase pdxT subunit